MDDTTSRVADLYRKYPYPSRNTDAGDKPLSELANLLRLFVLESRRDLTGLRVLDAGTGTGHRLVEAAAAFPSTTFDGIDAVPESLEIAARTAREARVQNVAFHEGDLMRPVSRLGTFDIVLCMGVLHHLSDPQRGLANLLGCLNDSGVMFLYVYGALGARERMRRKHLLAELLATSQGDFAQGITTARALGFDDMDFGWTHGLSDGTVPDSLIVDAYLNVHERLYDAGSIHSLMEASARGHSYMIYGVTRRDQGLLFDTRLAGRVSVPAPRTDVRAALTSEDVRGMYARLSPTARYRVLDLLFEPNGYTIMVCSKVAASRLTSASPRIEANLIEVVSSN